MPCVCSTKSGVGWLLCVASIACSFDTSSPGGSGQLGGTESEGSTSTTATSASASDTATPTSGPTNASDPSDPTTNDPTTAASATSETDDPPGAVAELALSDGADFGLVDLEGRGSFTFTLSNVGEATATAIAPSVMPAAFTIGDIGCGATLEPGAACTIEVAFAPQRIGPQSGSLTIAYDDGAADREVSKELVGAGQGQTRNLIDNPGAEHCSTQNGPPDDWMEVTGTNWTCIDTFDDDVPVGGSLMFFPQINPPVVSPISRNAPRSRPRSPISCRPASSRCDSVAGRSPRGPSATTRAASGSSSSTTPARRSTAGTPAGSGARRGNRPWRPASRTPPPPRMVVHLDCEVTTPDNCSAMFDDLELRFLYPPP